MADQPENTPNNNQQDPIQDLMGPGSRLRHAREQFNLGIEDVATRLHLRSQVIIDIENDDYSNMPKLVFVRGYLRSYAQLLGLPAEEVLAAFKTLNVTEVESDRPAWQLKQKAPVNSERPIRWVSYIIVLGMIALAGTWWHSHRQHKPGVATQANMAPMPLPSNPTEAAKDARPLGRDFRPAHVKPAVPNAAVNNSVTGNRGVAGQVPPAKQPNSTATTTATNPSSVQNTTQTTTAEPAGDDLASGDAATTNGASGLPGNEQPLSSSSGAEQASAVAAGAVAGAAAAVPVVKNKTRRRRRRRVNRGTRRTNRRKRYRRPRFSF